VPTEQYQLQLHDSNIAVYLAGQVYQESAEHNSACNQVRAPSIAISAIRVSFPFKRKRTTGQGRKFNAFDFDPTLVNTKRNRRPPPPKTAPSFIKHHIKAVLITPNQVDRSKQGRPRIPGLRFNLASRKPKFKERGRKGQAANHYPPPISIYRLTSHKSIYRPQPNQGYPIQIHPSHGRFRFPLQYQAATKCVATL
jgi:hypothetical protein